MDAQHAIFEFSLHVARVGIIRDAEVALTPAIVAFHAMELATLIAPLRRRGPAGLSSSAHSWRRTRAGPRQTSPPQLPRASPPWSANTSGCCGRLTCADRGFRPR